jgi:hypothetical protein
MPRETRWVPTFDKPGVQTWDTEPYQTEVLPHVSDPVSLALQKEAKRQRAHAQAQLDTQNVYPGRTPPGSRSIPRVREIEVEQHDNLYVKRCTK